MATSNSAQDEAAATAKGVKDDVAAGAEQVADKAKAAGREARSQVGDLEASLTRGAEDLTAAVTDTLKAVGVNPDHMVDVAKEQASDLQRMLTQEIQERPLRALGLAAAVGLFVGFIAAR